MSAERKQKEYEIHTFHSSVNRIPRLPNEARTCDPTNSDEIYQQGVMTSLDRLHPERLSGYFDLELTAHSPLILGEQTKEEGIHYIQIQKVDGKPYIAPTMIKGLLSTTYERITSSRFRIFDTSTHVKSLTYRTDRSQSLSLTPVRYTGETDTNENLRFEILDCSPSGDNKPAYLPIKYNKKVLDNRYKLNNAYTKELIKRFRHGDHVIFEAYRIKHRWIVTTISKIDDTHTLHVGEFQNNIGDRNPQTPITFTGYLYTTSPKDNISANNTNFSKKWAERIFIEGDVTEENIKSRFATCDQSTIARYHAVLNSYAEHQEAADKLQERRNRPKVTNNIFSRMNADERTLKKGDLAYALLDTKDRITELVPITVGRHAYSHAPNTLAEADGVNPARTLTEASAADRLFGFVGNDNESGTSLRGRVQIGPVSTSDYSTAVPPDGQAYVTVPPLLSPKPSSGRRFLVPKENFPDSPSKNTRRDQLYDPDYSSLGEATYPTHRSCIGQPLDKIIEKFSTSGGDLKTNESLQLHVRSWIKQGNVLACRVHFENLSSKELAFLVWPLIPENLSPDGRDVGFHKVGIGKPLGLGLVEARIVKNSLYLEKTQDITSGYKELNNVLGTHYEEVDVSTLLQHSEIGDLSKLPWVRAFQRAAYGFEDTDVPVRYVSLEENKANNATNKDGSPKYFDKQKWLAGRSPQSLWIEDSATVPEVFLSEVKTERSHESTQKTGEEVHSSDKSRKNQGIHRKKDRRTDKDTQHNASTSIDIQRDKSGPRRRRKRRPRD